MEVIVVKHRISMDLDGLWCCNRSLKYCRKQGCNALKARVDRDKAVSEDARITTQHRDV